MKARWIILIILLLVVGEPVWAKKYINDVLLVSLKDAASDSAKSIKLLKSGTELELVDNVKIEGYVQVKTGSGVLGWVKSRYLSNGPIARLQVSQLEKQVEELLQENSILKTAMSDTRKKTTEIEAESQRILSESNEIKQDNAQLTKLAAEPARVLAENNQLKAENKTLQTDYTQIKNSIDTTDYEMQQTWFLIGAGVLVTGIIFGLIIPRMRFRRQSKWL